MYKSIWVYYIMICYFFPVAQIYHSVKDGNRNNFKFCYQILLWPQSIIVPIWIRGFDNNFLRLTPYPSLPIALGSIMGLQIIVCILQKIFGPRFFVPLFLLYQHQYMVKVKS